MLWVVSLGVYVICLICQPVVQSNQVDCYLTRTSAATHQVVRDNLHLSCHIQETRRGRSRLCTSHPTRNKNAA